MATGSRTANTGGKCSAPLPVYVVCAYISRTSGILVFRSIFETSRAASTASPSSELFRRLRERFLGFDLCREVNRSLLCTESSGLLIERVFVWNCGWNGDFINEFVAVVSLNNRLSMIAQCLLILIYLQLENSLG